MASEKFKFDMSDFEPINSKQNQSDFEMNDFEPVTPKRQIKPFQERAKEMVYGQTPEQIRRNTYELGAGLTQGLMNVPISVTNWFRGSKPPYQKFGFAPETERSQFGEAVAPYITPVGVEAGVMGILSKIPQIANVMNKAILGLKARPFLNAGARATKGGAEVGLINALEHPESPGEAFKTGAEFGAPATLAMNALTSASPYLSLAARAGLGGLVGSQFGHPYSGALAGAAFPFKALMGIESRPEIAGEMLSGLTSKDISKSIAANRRLGTSVTPAEASGNYVVAGREGALKRTEAGANAGYRLEETQKYQQENAIKRMLDKIYKPTKANENQINNLYQQAYKMNVNPNVIAQMKTDPIMESAFSSVKRMPAFKNIPENNYEFLAQVDRTLGKQSNTLLNSANGSDRVSGFDIAQTKKSFNSFLKQNNPDYEAATKAAQPKIVRENVESKLNKEAEDFTAKNFYSKLLNSRKSYRELLKDTKNFPEAQNMIKDMRAGWKNLANMKTTSQSEAQSKSAISQARQILDFIKTAAKNAAGAKSDVARLKYIHSKDWEKDFVHLANIKDLKQRSKSMLEFVAKAGTAYGLSNGQIDNLINVMTQGSGTDGTNVSTGT